MPPPAKPHHPAFYPLLILAGLAGLCEVLLIVGALLGKFSWTFAIIWMVLLSFHMANIGFLARRSH